MEGTLRSEVSSVDNPDYDFSVGTHNIQSTVTISEMPSSGSPADDSTRVMVTRPPCGTPVAPIAATSAVILK